MPDWSARAEAYRNAPEQREGEDLDLIVRWAEGCETALDVATGGGHVARRLREAGLQVVSADPAPGMQPDVLCRAEDLPFADGASTSSSRGSRRTTSRTWRRGRRDGARLERPRRRRGHALRQRGRRGGGEASDPISTSAPTRRRSGGRCSRSAGLEVEQVEAFEKRHPLEQWLDRSADARGRPAPGGCSRIRSRTTSTWIRSSSWRARKRWRSSSTRRRSSSSRG